MEGRGVAAAERINFDGGEGDLLTTQVKKQVRARSREVAAD